MSDLILNPYPQRFADPSEPGVHLTFSEGEWATFQRFINRGAAGAAYDATTRVGCPLVGQGGGVYVADDIGSYVRGTAYAAGVDLGAEIRIDAVPAATRVPVSNGTGGPGHALVALVTGAIQGTMNWFGTTSTTPFSIVGRGPSRVDLWHDGTSQRLLVNGRLTDSDVGAFAVPAGFYQAGTCGNITRVRFRPVSLGSDAAYRASYVREFAKQVIFHWAPRDVGEGPAGGIPTGAVGEGDWSCPSGGANLKFVWVNDLSLPAGGFLALTDDGALSMRRLDFMIPKRPMFGSWLVRYRTRNTAIGGDCPRVGLISVRGNDMTAAGSQSIWFESLNNGGGWWRTQTYRENAGLIGVDADIDVTRVPNGDDCATLLTHHVDGNFRIWEFSRNAGGWFWRAAAVVNDVTFLNYNYFSIAPRGSLIKSVTHYQGEMTPHELGIRVS